MRTNPSDKYVYDPDTKEFFRRDGLAELSKETKKQRQCMWCHTKREIDEELVGIDLDLPGAHTISAWGAGLNPALLHTRYCFACGRKLVDEDD